jgi:manganese transport protein
LYVLAEIAIAACDLAEVLGMALGINLLTGLPLIWGVCITVFDTLILLLLQNFGIRKLEAVIIALVLIIGGSFLVEILLPKPVLSDVVRGFVPHHLSSGALYIAVGIIGATVMPHNLYLHSALVQTRKISTDEEGLQRAIKYNNIDSAVALNAAFFVNTAILVLAASVFFTTVNTDVAKIEDAHRLLEPLLGTILAPLLFAIALIAAGQSSTITGTYAGQIVMEGYINIRIDPWLRKLITRLLAIIPAVFTTILVYGDDRIDALLILSQVVLSVQLGFAMVPLIHFVSDKATMGKFAIGLPLKLVSWLVALILIYLNVKMVVEQAAELYAEPGNLGWKIVVAIAVVFFTWLFLPTTFLPLVVRHRMHKIFKMHGEIPQLQTLPVKEIKRIAIALGFSNEDEKHISYALAQGNENTEYILIHIVESVSSIFSGKLSDDDETRRDHERLNTYAEQLTQMVHSGITVLGFNHRKRAIVKIVEEYEGDLLVMGAHQHRGIIDYLFGETIESVRHRVKIPVLVVNI